MGHDSLEPANQMRKEAAAAMQESPALARRNAETPAAILRSCDGRGMDVPVTNGGGPIVEQANLAK